MTVYVTGDIHGGLDMQKLRDWELGDSLTSDDYLIVAGDFGFPWGFSAEECADIAWLESRPYTALFVDGNHERFDHWAERPMEPWHGGLTQRLSDTSPIRCLTRGEVFELDGSTIFTMGSATSVDKEYRIPYSSWWPQELPDERNFEEARTKLDSVGWKVDYVITHTCSTRMLSPTLYPAVGWNCPDVDRLTAFFDELEDRLDYKRWYYGHFHRDANPSSSIPCSTTASFAWATNSSPGMLRRGAVAGYSAVTVMFSRCARMTSQLKCSTSCSAERGVVSGAMPVCPASQPSSASGVPKRARSSPRSRSRSRLERRRPSGDMSSGMCA